MNAEKRVIFYLELLKKYSEIMNEITTELNNK